VLFDLDGTLLDTAPDMTAAVNRLAREERHLPALPVAAIRPTVSHGSPGMLKAGFGLTPDDPLYAELNPRFLALYREAIAVETVLFPGMAEVLDYLEAGSIPLGRGHQQAGLADRAAAEGAGSMAANGLRGQRRYPERAQTGPGTAAVRLCPHRSAARPLAVCGRRRTRHTGRQAGRHDRAGGRFRLSGRRGPAGTLERRRLPAAAERSVRLAGRTSRPRNPNR
jgi:hypothetical protein